MQAEIPKEGSTQQRPERDVATRTARDAGHWRHLGERRQTRALRPCFARRKALTFRAMLVQSKAELRARRLQ